MPFLSSRLRLAAVVLPVVFLAGCGGGNRLEGNVTLDGAPVDGGTISFHSPGGKGENASGRIEGGKYAIASKLPPGTYRVEINWLKPTGKKIPNKSDLGTMLDETKQTIATEYNRQSKLTAEVKSGSNTFNFDLKSGGPIDTSPPGEGSGRTKGVGD